MVKPRILILILICVAIAVAVAASVHRPMGVVRRQQALQQEETPTPGPKRTGTFVDALVGNVVFFLKGHLYQLSLPEQTVRQITGVDDQLIEQFPVVRPAFSSDGNLMAFVASPKTIAVVEYSTGKKRSMIHLDGAIDVSRHPELSFSPDSATVTLLEDAGSERKLQFFAVADGTHAGTVEQCGPVGFWLRSLSIYVSECVSHGTKTIVGMNSASHFVPVPVTADKSYTLLNAFNSSTMLVQKNGVYGFLTMDAKFTQVDMRKYTEKPSVAALKDPVSALEKRIQERLQTEPVDDVALSPDASYMIYHTAKGLWVVDIHLNNKPYFLIEGELPVLIP